MEDRALPVQTASYGELRRLGKCNVKHYKKCCVNVAHVCTFGGRHDMPWKCKPQFAIEGHVNGLNHLRKGDMSTLNPLSK